MELLEKAKLCKEASYELMLKNNKQKNEVLEAMAQQLEKQTQIILQANQKDIEQAKSNHKNESFIDRLLLDEKRMQDIIMGIRQVVTLPDPCHQVLQEWDKNDLHFIKKSVPIGVIGMIFEARPNVCVDAASLCLKSGNVCFLRGSKDTLHSNKALVKAMKDGLKAINMNEHCIALLEDTSREVATQFMCLNEYLDVLIPRGGAGLIQATLKNATVPIIETGTGNCHVYVDKDADFNKALAIIMNAKTQRVSVCNACESIVLHKDIVGSFLPMLVAALKLANVEIYADELCCELDTSLTLATIEDYAKEYLDYAISIKTVENTQSAIQHINQNNTMHSDVIVSENEVNIDAFLNGVDSACVYANASSRFSDGFEFGFGAEIGISTQKIHARGPMGLEALTSYKYLITGNGTIRK